MVVHDMFGRVLPGFTFKPWNVRRELGGNSRPSGVMSDGVINQFNEIGEIQDCHEGHAGIGHYDRLSRW